LPVAPASGCRMPRCPHRAVRRGCCGLHARDLERERRQSTRHDSLYTKRWRAESKAFLARPENAQCADCGQPSELVDHRIPHKGDAQLFWDRANWRPSCGACNRRKGIEREGGFGRVPSGSPRSQAGQRRSVRRASPQVGSLASRGPSESRNGPARPSAPGRTQHSAKNQPQGNGHSWERSQSE
jgi:5-methylcytosine-specific restriction enzyme A